MKTIERNIMNDDQISHISRKPSTTVRIARSTLSREKNGTAGSDAQEASDKMWLTMDTLKRNRAS